jgi:hypothetical protein
LFAIALNYLWEMNGFYWRGVLVNYEQCIEHIVISDGGSENWLTWVKIGVPTFTSLLSVAIVYFLTTYKDRHEKRWKEILACSQDFLAMIYLKALIDKCKKTNSRENFANLVIQSKGIHEYCELASKDVYQHSNISVYAKFAHVKRIAEEFRDEIVRLSTVGSFLLDLQLTNTPANLVQLATEYSRKLGEYTGSIDVDKRIEEMGLNDRWWHVGPFKRKKPKSGRKKGGPLPADPPVE